MLLTIDVGNTNTVLGIFDGDQIIEHWRINTDPDRTADEIAVLLRGLLEHSSLVKHADLSGIALCSTVPSVLHEMREMCRRYYGDVPSLIIDPVRRAACRSAPRCPRCCTRCGRCAAGTTATSRR